MIYSKGNCLRIQYEKFKQDGKVRILNEKVLQMKQLMSGNEAIAQGAWEAGVKVSTAYPGTPSTEITEYIGSFQEIDTEWSVNEKVALEIAAGASVAGARVIVSMKHVGLNVAMDPLMSMTITGVNGGVVIVVADDPGPNSSQNEQDTRWFAIAAKVPVLEPSDSAECKEFVIRAFDISEEFDTPVIIRLTTRIAHSQSLVTKGKRKELPLKAFNDEISKYIVVPEFVRIRRIEVEKRIDRLKTYAAEIDINRVEMNDRETGIIAGGICYQYAKEVFPDASYLKLGLAWPLSQSMISTFVKQCSKVYVIEEVESIHELYIKSWGLAVIGGELFPRLGELSSRIIREKISGTAPELHTIDTGSAIPVRPPVMCAGCHHRGPFYVLKKLNVRVSGDVGCYTLAAMPPLQAMHTNLCMGASIGMAFGIEKARGKSIAQNSVAVIGDSTFWHSGLTGLIDVVYNKGFTTVVILDNSTTAMTGLQGNPSTGTGANKRITPVLDIRKVVEAIGISRVFEVDAYNIVEFERILLNELNAEEPSVIITKQPCSLIKTNKHNDTVYAVDTALCTGCRECLVIGCPAISYKGNQIHIDSVMCTGCGVCSKVCAFSALRSTNIRNQK